MSVREDQIVRELSHYIYEHPGEQMALIPVYDAARDHAQPGTCTHSRRCPLVTTGAVVVDERNCVLSLRHEGAFALAEAEPEEEDDSLSGAAQRLLAEAVGIREVWTEPNNEGPFLIDVTRAGQHRYGPRLRIGFRYLFRAHSGAVTPMVIEAGMAAWMSLGEKSVSRQSAIVFTVTWSVPDEPPEPTTRLRSKPLSTRRLDPPGHLERLNVRASHHRPDSCAPPPLGTIAGQRQPSDVRIGDFVCLDGLYLRVRDMRSAGTAGPGC